MDFEEAFEKAGTFGRTQALIISLCCYITVYFGWQALCAVFFAIDVSFYCNQSDNYTTITDPDSLFDNTCIDGCREYVYSDDVDSIVKTFDLACGSEHVFISLANSAVWIGYLLSCFVSGPLSDKFGRKWPSFILNVILLLATFATAFSPNIYIYTILRFVAGFCLLGSSIVFLAVAETSEKTHFTYTGLSVSIIFFVGELFCTLFGYLLKTSWFWQCIIMAAFLVPYIIAHGLLLPESPRWLYSQGRIEETELVLKRLAKWNGRNPEDVWLSVPDDVHTNDQRSSTNNVSTSTGDEDVLIPKRLSFVEFSSENNKASGNITELFRTRWATLLTLCNMLTWFATALVFYGFTYDVQNFGGNVYLNAFLLSITEAPGWFICPAMDKWGRKKVLFAALVISSASSLISPFTQPLLDGKVTLGFAMVAKCLATGGIEMLYVYSPEQFPTVLRSTGLTLCSSAARVAVIVTPFLIELKYGPYDCLPFLLIGFTGLLTSVMVFLFAIETLGIPFITTAEEFHQLARQNKQKQNYVQIVDAKTVN